MRVMFKTKGEWPRKEVDSDRPPDRVSRKRRGEGGVDV